MDRTARAKPGISAGFWSKCRIAARGLRSLGRPQNSSGKQVLPMSKNPHIVSPDTLRDQRIPPRQVETRRWPVLHAGATPRVDLDGWDLRINGLVEQPVAWSWAEFQQLPRTTVFADMHCVTRWSRLANTWEGVLVRDVMAHVAIRPDARFVVVHAEQGFTTNLPLEAFLQEDCLFAWAHDGQPLEPDHGWPLRLVVPRLYAWKSAKWVRRIEFVDRDIPGFWEQNGYHNLGDPWREQRFWGE